MEIVTKAEREQIEHRLRDLLANRAVLSLRIEEARALGDLKENGDYHAAKDQQGLEEAEIRRLQARLAAVTVIDENTARAIEGLVVMGCTVKLRDIDAGDEDLFRLVGEASPNPSFDYVEVTLNSPMGEALHKARVGDTIRVSAPRGVKKFVIVAIV